MTKIDFTQILSGRNILKFPHCVFPIRLPRSVQSFSKIDQKWKSYWSTHNLCERWWIQFFSILIASLPPMPPALTMPKSAKSAKNAKFLPNAILEPTSIRNQMKLSIEIFFHGFYTSKVNWYLEKILLFYAFSSVF